MATKRRPVGRYSTREATTEVRKAMDRSLPPILDKEMAAHLGLDAGTFSYKIRMTKSSFTIEELGVIADFFRAPPGWPFVHGDVRREG
jgi:hypothetical protein